MPGQTRRYSRRSQSYQVGEATKKRPTLFKNMVNTLNHLHVVDLIWQAHIEGRDHGIRH